MYNRCLILIGSMIIFLTGCWDEIDIEERGFVVGAAIDLSDEQLGDHPTLKLKQQVVVPAGIGMPGGGGGGDQKAYKNISGRGESLFEIIRQMSTEMGRAAYYEHLKIVVVSEELASEPNLFASVMDLFIRDHEMRREIRVIVSEQEAQEILEVESKTEKLPVMYINNVLDNTTKAGGLIEPIRMGDIHEHLLEDNNYVIPKVTTLDDKIQFRGAGIFRGGSNRLVGTINDEESVGLNLIKGELKGGFIKFEIDNELMVYELKKVKSNIKINAKDPENISIELTIDTEGDIGEMYGDRSILDKKYLSEIEQKVNKKIEFLANKTITKGQEELNVDFFGFSDILEKKHYDTWNKIKDNWDSGDNLFANSDIKVTADAVVRATGASDRAKDRGSE